MVNSGPSVLMTGAAGNGIGNQLCRVFHERGFRVIATARDAARLADLAALGMETVSLDVNDAGSIKACRERVAVLLGGGDGGKEAAKLDYLYHNAGINYTVPCSDVDLAEVRFTFETNVFAVMALTQAFLPLLMAARGTIVATGSVAGGVLPFWFGGGYNASKAALKAYLDTLRVELAPFSVHVVNVVTAGVRSDIARTRRQLPAQSIFRPDFVALYQARLVRSQTSGMATRPYAEQVAAAVARSRGRLWNTNNVWAGGRVRAIWWAATLDWFLPGGIWGLYIRHVEGLKAVA